MRVLVACEYSGVVREAFRARGHDAWSCDLLPAEDNSPYHLELNIGYLIPGPRPPKFNAKHPEVPTEWDLMIAHPPCTYLCNSGWHWTKRELEASVSGGLGVDRLNSRWRKSLRAVEFFHDLFSMPIDKICIENPVPGPLLKTMMGSPSQYIQPYMFGDDASKKTGLWLKNLPALSTPPQDEWYPPRIVDGKKRWGNQTDSGQNKLPPSEDRWKERSRTYQGIAKAMAEQWG